MIFSKGDVPRFVFSDKKKETKNLLSTEALKIFEAKPSEKHVNFDKKYDTLYEEIKSQLFAEQAIVPPNKKKKDLINKLELLSRESRYSDYYSKLYIVVKELDALTPIQLKTIRKITSKTCDKNIRSIMEIIPERLLGLKTYNEVELKKDALIITNKLMINLNDNYSQKEFKFFLKNFLPEDYEEKNSKLHIEETHKFFKKAVLLGSVRSLHDLKIIEVERIKPEKSRIKITKELFKFIETHGYKNALVITYSEKEDHYRFSLILSDLVWVTEKKVKKEFSNQKRLSFLLGPDKIHTANKQLIKSGKIKSFEDLYQRFNVEIVNNEFFDNYRIFT